MFSPMEPLSSEEIEQTVKSALFEDIGSGDVTTLATVPEETSASAVMRAREPLVIAGLPLAEAAFRQLSNAVQISRVMQDGQHADSGNVLLQISGPARALLTAERVALNFVQRLSGVASLTAQFVKAIHGTNAKILETRKTTPGWRRLEKYAVACGGGQNHRLGLFDMVLIKDNHLAALKNASPNPIAAAVKQLVDRMGELKSTAKEKGTQPVAYQRYLTLVGYPLPKQIRKVDPAQAEMARGSAEFYIANGLRFKKGFRKIG